MDKQALLQVVQANIADIAILHRGILQDPNYFPPTIPSNVFDSLPIAFAEAISQYETDEEKSIALLSSLCTVAAGLHDIKIPYRKKRYNCNLYQVIVGPPASNKGISIHSRTILSKIQIRLDKEYKVAKAQYLKALNAKREKENQENMDSLESEELKEINIESEFSSTEDDDSNKFDELEVFLEEPNQKFIVLPSDVSSAALVDLIERNEGFGLVFDSEAQTILNTFKQDWGANLVSMLLKTFENEPLELARKSMKSMISIPEPRLSVLLTGNPEHLFGLVKTLTNGLYSRFCIYQTQKIGWMDMNMQENNKDYNRGYESLSILVDQINESLSKGSQLEFKPTEDQIYAYNQFFGSTDEILTNQIDPNFSSVVKRMGVICFRIASVLSAIRKRSNVGSQLTCSNEDFAVALNVCSTLLKHSVYTFLTTEDTSSPIVDFLSKLPGQFNRQQALQIADQLGIKSRRMDGFLKELAVSKKITKVAHGLYKKSTPATLQYLQYVPESVTCDEADVLPNVGELSQKIDLIESEFPKSEFTVDEIAQIAKLQPPVLVEEEQEVPKMIKIEEPSFRWLRNVYACTHYNENDLLYELELDGFESIEAQLEQIRLAVQFGKLEVWDGLYSLNTPCF